jgi:ornithine carbamoyltransferase
MTQRNFLTLSDLSSAELMGILQRARELKAELGAGRMPGSRPGRVLAMIFEKASTRTRVSFETGMAQLGGHAIFLSPEDTQLGRGEPVEDTARVLSKIVDCVMIRTHDHGVLERFAECSDVPVINGLSEDHHPCQLLADLQTFIDMRGSIEGKRVAWIGDGNNMCHSYIEAARLCRFHLHIACPDGYGPDAGILQRAGQWCSVGTDAEAAAAGADLVVTDVWASMGQEQEARQRMEAFRGYQVDRRLMKMAASNALFMHCLPAHRGEEVEAEVIDGPQSVVWEEAGNRLHSQKALLEFLLP